MRWITCEECETEYKVMSDSLEHTNFCPFCGSTVDTSQYLESEHDEE